MYKNCHLHESSFCSTNVIGSFFMHFPWEVKHVSTHTQINQLQDKRMTARAGWLVRSGSRLIGWLRSSQFGVVLQDDLQLLTQHDVPSNLQLAREERLAKQQGNTWGILFVLLIDGWLLVVFKCTGSTMASTMGLTPHINDKETSRVLAARTMK